MHFSAKQLAQFQHRLLRWYAREKRAMPWRGTRDPYRIWLSEVMLQQTRVAAVVDYYTRFVDRFPTVQDLAQARSDDVMRLWAGLGYYSRARNLHAAAKKVVTEHNGKFPATYDGLRALPGVGDYTAAAIASIAYDLPHAVLDGNVARVLARLFAIRGDLRPPARWRQLQALAEGLLPLNAARKAAASPGDWNQAMMELGATVCTPRGPQCGACPVATVCRARKLGIADKLPAKRKKRATEDIHLVALVLLDAKRRTLLTREANQYFSRLWQFPAAGAKQDLPSAVRRLLRGVLKKGIHPRTKRSTAWLPQVRHTVTYRSITIQPCVVRIPRLAPANGARAVPLEQLGRLPVSSATRKIARAAQEHLRQLRASEP